MDKKINTNVEKFTEKYTEFTAIQNIGAYWIGQVRQYLPGGDMIIEASAIQVILWKINWNVPFSIVIVYILIKKYGWMFANWYGGKIVKKMGVTKAQNNFLAMEEDLSPFNRKLVETLNIICKALNIKSGFGE